MQAAWIDAFGDAAVIRVGSRPVPQRAPSDVLVRMRSATLNHRDLYVCRGEAGGVTLPVVLGSDGAGEVVESDPLSPWQPGRRVVIYPVLACGVCRNCRRSQPHKCLLFGMIGGHRDGTHAEFVSVPEACLVGIPDGLDFDAAAALSLAGLTAWNMIVDEGAAESGEHALVLGASGGVGVFAVLILKRLGLTVHAVTSSPAKRRSLLSLGADTVVDDEPGAVLRHARQLPDRGVDIALNCVGGSTWRYVPAAVRTGGRILVCGTVKSPVAELDMRQIFYRQLRIIGCSMGNREALARVLEIAASDTSFRAPIDSVIALDQIADAHRRMADRQITGKVVIRL